MRFRQATVEEVEEVVALVARADLQSADWAPGGLPHAPSVEGDRRRLTERIGDSESHSEVAAAEDGRIVGFANLEPRGADGHLSYLFVDPAHQGRGLGAQLMQRALAEAARRGFTRATLRTPVLNSRARQFYERAGWAETGEIIHFDEIGLDMTEYELLL